MNQNRWITQHRSRSRAYKGLARKADPDTSHSAARAIDAESLSEVCVSALYKIGPSGFTAQELARYVDRDQQSITPRLNPLWKAGQIVRTDEKRKNTSGVGARVWVHRHWWDHFHPNGPQLPLRQAV